MTTLGRARPVGRRGRGVIVFESFGGRYSDNPRAVSEELRRRGSPLEHVWVLRPDAGPVPNHVTSVPAGSTLHTTQLERADAIVSNDVIARPFVKSRATTYLQTWHGTPLKRVGFDVPRPSWPGSAVHYGVDLGRDVARWDVLLSPNAYSTTVLPRAFRYDGAVVESGYPRNDLLLSAARDEIRASVRAELGLADDVLAALYLPTWRDGDYWSLALDPAPVAALNGDRCVLLVRAHGLLVETGVHMDDHPSVRDVSTYQDVRELYLAADVLITDYSSSMFDFAVTGKPILLYVYDLDRYRDELRGFYFDLWADPPGPLLRTSADVAAALADLSAVTRRYADGYARFRDRFCAREDGCASARVVDVLLAAVARTRETGATLPAAAR